jgi:hypothetical protein
MTVPRRAIDVRMDEGLVRYLDHASGADLHGIVLTFDRPPPLRTTLVGATATLTRLDAAGSEHGEAVVVMAATYRM